MNNSDLNEKIHKYKCLFGIIKHSEKSLSKATNENAIKNISLKLESRKEELAKLYEDISNKIGENNFDEKLKRIEQQSQFSDFKYDLCKVNNTLVEFGKSCGYNFEDYSHTVSMGFRNHVIKHHGNPVIENHRKQIEVKGSDISDRNLTKIVDNPDFIIIGLTSKNNNSVISVKVNDNTCFLVEEILEPKRKQLKAKTFWIASGINNQNEILEKLENTGNYDLNNASIVDLKTKETCKVCSHFTHLSVLETEQPPDGKVLYQASLNPISDKDISLTNQNIQSTNDSVKEKFIGATAMNENEKSTVKKMDEELEKTILREQQEMEEIEAETAVAKAVDETVQTVTEENNSESLLGKILDDKEKEKKENILEEEKSPNNVFLLNRNDELSNEVERQAITDSVFSANESERSIYDEIPKIFEDLNTHFNESVREKENWDFRYKGIKIGEVSKDGSIKFCENEKLSELNLDLEKIKEQISSTNFAKRENFSFEENCNLGEDRREEKYVKMFEEQQKAELENEIEGEEKTPAMDETIVQENLENTILEDSIATSVQTEIDEAALEMPDSLSDYEQAMLENDIAQNEMNAESFAKDFAQKIQSANLEEVNSLFDDAREQNIDMSAISDFRDEKGNNVLHLAAKNPNLTAEMLTVFHKNLGAEKSTELYFDKNEEDKIPLDVSRTENFSPDKNVNFEKTFGSKKQIFDVPKPFTAMSIGSSVALEFEKNKNPDKFNIDNAAFNSVMKKSLQDQMTQRKNLIEKWDFRNDAEGIAQAFENKGVSFDEKARSNIISYDFVHFAGSEKKVLDSIKLSENKDGLSILESSNANLTALMERNFKIEKDKDYKLFRDISNTTAFMNVPGKNEPTPNYKEFPQDYMKQNGYFPPMIVQNSRNENGEKSVLVAGKDEFGNPCEYKMNETQVSNVIHNSMNYAAKNGEKIDFLNDKNVVPLSHIEFIKNHEPNADIGIAFRDSLTSFEKQHNSRVFVPFVKDQEFKQKMEQEANLEKAKKLAYEQNQTLGGMER